MKFNKIPFNTPELCGNCTANKDCICRCHFEKICGGYHEFIAQSRELGMYTTWQKMRHFLVTKLRLKVASV